jgi:septin family protein
MTANKPLLAVVGNCASGKTTLVNSLNEAGYRAVNIPQEHSEIKRLWKYKKPNLLVLLSCTLETAQKRRPGFAWTEKQLEVQRERLNIARDECNLYLVTDNLGRKEVLSRVIDLLEREDVSHD